MSRRAGLDRQSVRVMLVRRETRPSALADGKQLGNQQASDAPSLILPEYVLDLPVGLGFVGAVLDDIELIAANVKRFKHLVAARTRDEHLGLFRSAGQDDTGARWRVHALRLSVPNIPGAVPEPMEREVPDRDVDGPSRGNNAGLVSRDAVFETLALAQLDDVEVGEGNTIVVSGHDRFVSVVMGRNVHEGVPMAAGRWLQLNGPVMRGQEFFERCHVGHGRRTSHLGDDDCGAGRAPKDGSLEIAPVGER